MNSRRVEALYNARTNSWSVIFRDIDDDAWFVWAEDLEEEVARASVRGFQS